MQHIERNPGVKSPPDSFDIEIDVAVIGGGGCGLSAAAVCAQNGAETVVFERDYRSFGSTGMSYGSVCAAGTELQKRSGISDHSESLVADILTAAKGQTDPSHALALAENARDAMNWLTEDMHQDFSIEKNWVGYGHQALRLHATPARSGEQMIAILHNLAMSSGATIVTESDVTDIFVDHNQLPCGIGYNCPDGYATVGCHAIIIASSGFAANKQLVARHIAKMQTATYHGAEWHMGDALHWASQLGVKVADLGAYQALGNLAIPHNIVVPHTLLIDGGFAVNTCAQRFHNELENISGQALTILEQPNGYCWLVYDERGHQKAKSVFLEYKSGDEIHAYKSARTIAELAAKMRVEGEQLANTLAEVERCSGEGIKDNFGRQFKPEHLLRAPYYAVKVTGSLFHTQGGICVDPSARLLKTDGTVINNLFAGGGAIRSVSGPAEWGYLPGIGLATALGFGWRAGKEAANLIGRK